MDELNMTGNCLKGSRPLLSFDKTFDNKSIAHLPLIKELLTQAFATPKTSRKQKPFIDHVFMFSVCDGRIWFRNYQIVEKKSGDSSQVDGELDGVSLVEIGPRFVMNVMRVFDGSFGGKTLFENPDFISPNMVKNKLFVTVLQF